MPRKDGTGPAGKGPKTGRGLGNCNNDNTFHGFGAGKGRSGRRGHKVGRGK